jgi:hypothetical protein
MRSKFKNIELLIRILSTSKCPGLYGFIVKFYQVFKDELIPTLEKLFQKWKRRNIAHLVSSVLCQYPTRQKHHKKT